MRVTGSEFTDVGLCPDQIAGAQCARRDVCTAHVMHPCHWSQTVQKELFMLPRRRDENSVFHFHEEALQEGLLRNISLPIPGGFWDLLFSEQDETGAECRLPWKRWKGMEMHIWKNKRSYFHGVWKKKACSEEPYRDRPDLKSRLISDAGTHTHTVPAACLLRKQIKIIRNIQTFHALCLKRSGSCSSEAIRRSCAFLYIPKTQNPKCWSETNVLLLSGKKNQSTCLCVVLKIYLWFKPLPLSSKVIDFTRTVEASSWG